MPTQLRSSQTLLFIGDSITDCGRRDRDGPLGSGYVRLFSDLLTIREPAKRVRILNRGIGGNTADDLRSRWSDHVIAHRPDWLVIKIGINDTNRFLLNPDAHPLQSPEKFAEILESIVARTRRELPDTRLLLLSPFYASTDSSSGAYRSHVRQSIPLYIEAVRATAERHSAGFVDLHAAVQKLLRDLPADQFAEDAVHPGTAGALFIAEQVYAALSKR